MSRWIEQFNAHPIHATLEWLRESVSNKNKDADATEVSEKRRLLKIVSKFEDVLQNLDPEVIPFGHLDALNTALRQANVTNQINAYISNKNVAHLAAANDQISNQLATLSAISGLCGLPTSPTLVNDLEKLIDSTSAQLVEEKNALSEKIDNLTGQVNTNENRLTDLNGQIDQNKSEVNAQISKWQSQFSSAQESRSQDFNKWRDDFASEKNADIEKAIKSYNDALTNYKTKFKSEIEAILSDGKQKHESILELYQLTAGDSVGAGYIKNADEEKSQADIWRRISVGLIVATISWMLFAYYSNSKPSYEAAVTLQTPIQQTEDTKPKSDKKDETQTATESHVNNGYQVSNEIPWALLFITFSISGILLWGSAYSAQQSTKHRKNEKRTRWFALEVKAIDPFISSLNSEQQNALKKELSEKMFGQFSNEDDSKVIDEHVLKIVADTISGVISKIPK